MIIKKVYLGKIVGSHGLKGLVKVELYNNNFLDLKSYEGKVHIENLQINLEKKFYKGKLYICSSKNFSRLEDVSLIVGKELWIDENHLEKINSSEYFHKDLINCKVYDNDSKCLGEVTAIHNFGAGDLLELSHNFKHMIRFYDLRENDIDIKKKIIRLNKNYEL